MRARGVEWRTQVLLARAERAINICTRAGAPAGHTVVEAKLLNGVQRVFCPEPLLADHCRALLRPHRRRQQQQRACCKRGRTSTWRQCRSHTPLLQTRILAPAVRDRCSASAQTSGGEQRPRTTLGHTLLVRARWMASCPHTLLLCGSSRSRARTGTPAVRRSLRGMPQGHARCAPVRLPSLHRRICAFCPCKTGWVFPVGT